MEIPTIRLDFDLEPGALGRASGERVRLPKLRQGADYRQEIGFRSDSGADHDFTVYDEIVMTVRASVQSASPALVLKKSTGELIAGTASLTIAIPAAMTSGIAIPEPLPRFAGPQAARFGHDIRLMRGAHAYPLAEGVLVMVYAFTR